MYPLLSLHSFAKALFFPFHHHPPFFKSKKKSKQGMLFCVGNYLGGLKGILIFGVSVVPELLVVRQPLSEQRTLENERTRFIS